MTELFATYCRPISNNTCIKAIMPPLLVKVISLTMNGGIQPSLLQNILVVCFTPIGLLSCPRDINPTSLSSSIIWCLGSSEFPCLLLLQSFFIFFFNIVMSIWFKWAHYSMRLNRIPMSHKWSRTKYLVAHHHAWTPLKQIG